MGAISVSHVSWSRPGGELLLDDVSFHVSDGSKTALIGANGAGKTTLLRLIAGEYTGYEGNIAIDGRLGVMNQLVGSIRDATTVRELYVSLSPDRIREAAARLVAAEATMNDDPMRYANALANWGEVGGYDIEVTWDAALQRAVGDDMVALGNRPVSTFSGGQQKRLALEFLLKGEHDVLLLDEPDNFLDIPGKRWLEGELRACQKTILFVSHDRELLANAATRIVTVEGFDTWTHGEGFATYHAARQAAHGTAREGSSPVGSRAGTPRCARQRDAACEPRSAKSSRPA